MAKKKLTERMECSKCGALSPLYPVDKNPRSCGFVMTPALGRWFDKHGSSSAHLPKKPRMPHVS